VCLPHRAYADSKTLTEAQREGLYQQVRGDPQLGAISDSLSAATLSAAALGRTKVSLNELAARSTCGLIQRALDAGVQLRKVKGEGGAAAKLGQQHAQRQLGVWQVHGRQGAHSTTRHQPASSSCHCECQCTTHYECTPV
jgi:hypothetical protein